MSDTGEDTGGRRNAIVTYAKMDQLAEAQIRTESKMDLVLEKVEDLKAIKVDHEVRLRAVELVIARTEGSNSGLSLGWQILIGAGGLIAAGLALFMQH